MSQSILRTTDELQAQFDHLHTLSRDKPLLKWRERELLLDNLETMLRESKDKFASTISEDFNHRSKDETMFAEVFPSFQNITHVKKHGKSWMKTRKVGVSPLYFPASNEIQPQPLGVVGIIVPWNYPLNLSIGPIIDAIAAGNRVMVKMSETAPKFAEAFAEAVSAHFSPDIMSVAVGEVDLAQAFTELPFDHMVFTGSSAVGKKVMEAAAPNLTPVTLELGGKSPVVVLDDADIEQVVNRVMMGKTLNSGQTCIAPDYVLLNEKHHDKFISLAKDWVAKHYPKIVNNDDYTHIISDNHFDRLQSYLTKLPEDMVVPLTKACANSDTRLMPPVIVRNPAVDSVVMTEELFGPILPLVHSDDLKSAVSFVNSRPRPLALYIFGNDDNDIKYVRDNTVSGGVSVNEVILHNAQSDLPFGGVGNSGIGAYHGKAGFERFSHMKPVFVQSKINGMNMLLPPYGTLFKKAIGFFTK